MYSIPSRRETSAAFASSKPGSLPLNPSKHSVPCASALPNVERHEPRNGPEYVSRQFAPSTICTRLFETGTNAWNVRAFRTDHGTTMTAATANTSTPSPTRRQTRRVAEPPRERDHEQPGQHDRLGARQGREPEHDAERDEPPHAGAVGGGVREQQCGGDEEREERLAHQRRFGEEQHRVDRAERAGDHADRGAGDPAADVRDEHDGAAADDREPEPLGLDAAGAEPGEQRQHEREQRGVLGGGHDAPELREVERPDVAAAVGQVVGEQVVRAGVTDLGDVRVHEQDHEHPHDERGEPDEQRPAPEARGDPGGASSRGRGGDGHASAFREAPRPAGDREEHRAWWAARRPSIEKCVWSRPGADAALLGADHLVDRGEHALVAPDVPAPGHAPAQVQDVELEQPVARSRAGPRSPP